MYQNVPITERVEKVRAMYRAKKPKIDINRYRIVTEFYMANPQLPGILKRARVMRELFEKMPVPVRDHELIVGHPGVDYRSSALYPEHSFYWFFDEIDTFPTRGTDPYDLDPEDRAYIEQTGHFWDKNCTCAMIDDIYPDKYREYVCGNGVLNFLPVNNCQHPIGHYCGNYWTVVDKGLGAVLAEARARKAEMLERGLQGGEGQTFQFYRAMELVTEGLIIYTKRYGAECARQAEKCADPARKAELLDMADRLNRIIEKPCESYYDALQACFMYQLALLLESQPHGISYGRLDQYCGKYLEADLASGKLTKEQAQELTDMFILKVAEINKVWSERATKSGPGYTAGQLITLGGIDRDGNDATNAMTYMVMQSSARLKLHNPPLALRLHAGTPEELWEAGIETTKQVGGVPCFEWDDTAIEALVRRGIPLEEARNYTLIGCVEPCVCGNDFANSGGDGHDSYTILPAALWCAINNGVNPGKFPGATDKPTGVQCGYLKDMTSMQQVLDAYKAQIDYFCKWQVTMLNCYEYIYAMNMPLPMLSCTLTGCMESGKDAMWGGAVYNNTGNTSIGHGNVADSLNIIDQVCFRDKIATPAELYDALINDWKGHEELHQYILGRCVHFGNNDPEADKYLKFVADTYAEAITKGVSPRGNHLTAGCWPVTLNVVYGGWVCATPDGRKSGTPLSDGISPVQSMDKNGPFATINSILKFDQANYANGTLCNMKFHPTALQGAEGDKKLRAVMETYFRGGGMELQINVVSAKMLREAQEKPKEYEDLVVRIAGFSAYFVEVYKAAQDDLIRRTEMSV